MARVVTTLPGTMSGPTVRPLVLPANQPRRFYAGGNRIASWRGDHTPVDHAPEDWVASTTTLFGEETAGLSVLPGGRTLRAAIAADAVAFLGPRHAGAFGPDLGMLVKLLDAEQRLPVHAHPDRRFAAAHLGCRYGKTEAWFVLDAAGDDAAVYLGLREGVTREQLEGWVRDQDAEAMLDALHRLTVRPGDTVLVPAGTPHAIGSGVFVVELQEPTDLSVLLEWRSLADVEESAASLGMGWPTALECVNTDATSGAELEELRSSRSSSGGVTPLFPMAADRFFRADLVQVTRELAFRQELSLLVALEGEGELAGDFGAPLVLRSGATVLVPWAAGETTVRGDVTLLRCRPPETAP